MMRTRGCVVSCVSILRFRNAAKVSLRAYLYPKRNVRRHGSVSRVARTGDGF